MKILITGGAGFIGSNIALEAQKRNYKTYILDDFSSSNFKNLEEFKGEVIVGDILDINLLSKLPKFDVVIHQAAITDTTLKDDKKMLYVNFNGFKNILNFCLSKKTKKLIYASSAGVYGDGPSPMKENQKLHPLNTYAYSKYLCDREVLRLIDKKKFPLKIIGLRYFNVYGPGEYHKKSASSMIYQLYLQMKQNPPPRIFKYGEQKRDFVYVKDVVEITLKCIEINRSVILNVGKGEARSFNEIIDILNKVIGTNFKPDYFDNPYQGVYQDFTQADISLLQKVLKIKPKFSLEEGIKDYVTNYLER